jgi:hypothetical protein
MRFRRTKDELARGLSPEQAKAEREGFQSSIAVVAAPPMAEEEAEEAYNSAEPIPAKKAAIEKIVRKITRKGNGEIVIRIRPAKGVDSDYFEHLGNREIEVTQDDKFYGWLDHYAGKVYDEHGQAKLFQDLLDSGIGELIKNIHLTKDIK